MFLWFTLLWCFFYCDVLEPNLECLYACALSNRTIKAFFGQTSFACSLPFHKITQSKLCVVFSIQPAVDHCLRVGVFRNTTGHALMPVNNGLLVSKQSNWLTSWQNQSMAASHAVLPILDHKKSCRIRYAILRCLVCGIAQAKVKHG